MREDRTVLACNQFIREVLGESFVKPVTDLIVDYYEETRTNIPVLYLLAAGADPTSTIDDYARKRKIITGKVSMGEEMQFPAAKMMDEGMLTGKWVVL